MSITVENSAVKRIQELRDLQNKSALKLRITVDSGGCSGFQYDIKLCEDQNDDDQTFEGTVVTDDLSMPFLEGSVIKFEKGLIGSEFKIENPNATSGCGCGVSFSV